MNQTELMQQGPDPLEHRRRSFYEEYQASIDRCASAENVGKQSKAQSQQGASAAQLVADHENELVRRQLELRNKPSSKKAQPKQAISTTTPRLRGTSPYCAYRRVKKGTKPYRTPTKGQCCECPGTDDHPQTLPSDWTSTPAEAEWDYSLPNGGWHQRKRVVRFAEPIVSKVYEFDTWVLKAYGVYVPMSVEETRGICEKKDLEDEWMEEADEAMEEADDAIVEAMRAWGERKGKLGEDDEDEDEDEMEWWEGDEMERVVEDGKEGGDWVVVEDDCMVVD